MATVITPVADVANARIVVTVTGATGSQARVARLSQAGVLDVIRGADPVTWVGGGAIFLDFEAPLDEPVSYQILNVANDGVQATSGMVTLASNDVTWLKHPGRPDLNIPLNVISFPEEDYDLPQGVFNVIGRPSPVVISSQRFSATGTLTTWTDTLSDRDAMKAILDSGSVLLLQTPADYGIGSQYVAVGAVVSARNTTIVTTATRIWTLPLTYVDKPVGLASAGVGNSWDDVVATYASWNDVMAAKATWNDLVTRVAP